MPRPLSIRNNYNNFNLFEPNVSSRFQSRGEAFAENSSHSDEFGIPLFARNGNETSGAFT